MDQILKVASPLSPPMPRGVILTAHAGSMVEPGRIIIAGGVAVPAQEGVLQSTAVPPLNAIGRNLTLPQSVILAPGNRLLQRASAFSVADADEDCSCDDCACEESCECCCDCSCSQEPPAVFADVRHWGCTTCDNSKESVIGVFVEGIEDPTPEEQVTSDRLSGIRYLCRHYGGESWLYRGEFSPSKTKGLAETIFERLRNRICSNSYWDRARSKTRKYWAYCDPITVDLFGFSRGGATVTRVATLLSEDWKCPDCPGMPPRGPFIVRFLGVIDPHGEFVEGTGVLPPNVENFFAAYGTRAKWPNKPTIIEVPRSPDSALRTYWTDPYDLPHGEMDDFDPRRLDKDPSTGMEGQYENSPTNNLIKTYRSFVSGNEFDPEHDNGPCRMENR